jgi:hypothetical protein
MKAAGAWVFSAALSPPSTATVVRFQGSEMLITDGPYAEAKEQVASEAALAYDAAIARSENAVERDFLRRRRQALSAAPGGR